MGTSCGLALLLGACFGPRETVVRTCAPPICPGDGGAGYDGGSSQGEAGPPAGGPGRPAVPDSAAPRRDDAPSSPDAARPGDGAVADAGGPAPLGDASGPPLDSARADAASSTTVVDAPRPVDLPPRSPDAPVPPDAAAPPPDRAPPPPDAGPAPGPCPPNTCKRVFLSSAAIANGGFGGAAVADGRCQMLADARGLGGIWRAWLSDGTGSPSTRFARATVPYRLLNGVVVATSWTDLADGTLAHAIDVYEDGASVPAGPPHEVWTGTTAAGATATTTCASWTNSTATGALGLVGLSDRLDARWTVGYTQFCDRTDIRLYCFEQ